MRKVSTTANLLPIKVFEMQPGVSVNAIPMAVASQKTTVRRRGFSSKLPTEGTAKQPCYSRHSMMKPEPKLMLQWLLYCLRKKKVARVKSGGKKKAESAAQCNPSQLDVMPMMHSRKPFVRMNWKRSDKRLNNINSSQLKIYWPEHGLYEIGFVRKQRNHVKKQKKGKAQALCAPHHKIFLMSLYAQSLSDFDD
jgi:hypothetical protein